VIAEDEAGTPRWLAALERAQALAHRAGRILEAAPPSHADLRPAARAVEAALGALLDAIDLRAERLGAVRTAQAELDRGAAAIASLPADAGVAEAEAPLREARGALSVAQERLSRVPPEVPPVTTPELRASGELPAVHVLPRSSLLPALRVPDPLPPPPEELPPIAPPRTQEELTAAMAEVKRRSEARREARRAREEEARRAAPQDAGGEDDEPPEGFTVAGAAPMSAADFLASRTRELFEEVALTGSQRSPLPEDPWRSSKVLERRMLAAIDAIAALGPGAVARIEPLARDAPAKDPARAFAAAMVLGCIGGRDALSAAERVLWHFGPADPEIASAFAGALKLVPHPALPLSMRSLLSDPDPACRAIAIDVLSYRGLATPAELSAAARDPDARVAAPALPALGLARAPDLADAAARALGAADRLGAAEPALIEAAWLAMVLGGHPHATTALHGALRGPLGARAAVLLAIGGDDRDAAALLERLRAAPSPALAAAAGWSGSPEAVPALIDLLEHKDPAVQLAAASALDRITGARLYEEVEVEPEAIEVPDVAEPEAVEVKPPPLARAVSDPRDLPSEGANDKVLRPTLRPDAWRAHWADRLPEIRPGARYRRGHPYTPAVSLWELDTWLTSPSDRRLLQRELVVRTGQVVRFDPHDFVVAQEEALRRWEPIAQRSSGAPGAWPRPMRR
jgi:hypothetical protein